MHTPAYGQQSVNPSQVACAFRSRAEQCANLAMGLCLAAWRLALVLAVGALVLLLVGALVLLPVGEHCTRRARVWERAADDAEAL